MFEQQSSSNAFGMSSTATPTKEKGQDAQQDRSHFHFPWKLHEMLAAAEHNGNASIVSWLPGGKAFKVHKKQEFTAKILPAMSNATKYKSFQRNLNLWCFETITKGPHKGGSFHPLFVKGDPDRCQYMTREKIKNNTEQPSGAPPSLHCADMTSTRTPTNDEGDQFEDAEELQSSSNPFSIINRKIEMTSTATEGQDAQQDRSHSHFPWKLHEMLAAAEHSGNASIVSWLPGGKAFKIHKKFEFTTKILPTMFGTIKYKSFQRNLNLWCFETIPRGPYKGGIFHPLFVKGDRDQCQYMTREKIKNHNGRPTVGVPPSPHPSTSIPNTSNSNVINVTREKIKNHNGRPTVGVPPSPHPSTSVPNTSNSNVINAPNMAPFVFWLPFYR